MKQLIVLTILLAAITLAPAQAEYTITKIDGLTVSYELVLDKASHAAKKNALAQAQNAFSKARADQVKAEADLKAAQTALDAATAAVKIDLGSSVSLENKDVDAIIDGPGTEAQKRAALLALIKAKIEEGIAPFLQSRATGSALSPAVGTSVDVP